MNTRTRLRDQERAPIAADLKRSMREKAKVDELTFALSADLTEAHCQVPIHPDDWHYLGCQVIPRGDVFVNTVGTFGIASASYYWSRVAGAIGRLLQYLSGHTSTSWHMLVADDYQLESGGPGYRCGWRPAIMAQDLQRRYSHLGRLRDTAEVEVCWYFVEARRVVYTVGGESC